MNEDELRNLRNVLNSDFGTDTIFCILKNLGAFDDGLNRASSAKEDYLILGKREKGKWLLNCLFQANKDKFLEIIERSKKEK